MPDGDQETGQPPPLSPKTLAEMEAGRKLVAAAEARLKARLTAEAEALPSTVSLDTSGDAVIASPKRGKK